MKNTKGFIRVNELCQAYDYVLEYAFVCGETLLVSIQTTRKTQPRIVFVDGTFNILDESMTVDLDDVNVFVNDVKNARILVNKLNYEMEYTDLKDFMSTND